MTSEDSLCAVAIRLGLLDFEESFHTCQRGTTFEDSLCAMAIGLGLLDFEERALAHASEVQLLQTRYAQRNRTRSFRL